ncbi:hypothetical protein [Leptolyngbya sp. O-77]|uniref:hypothetical protein n=1 Tax=Leptolyngbya sp. O-77 TaxID=1080068 RepID=UPI002570666C|nr:hypothetical protein [Leptolyngbya sp. O-77]
MISSLRVYLMRLHKQLLESERIRYEQVRGTVSKGELLQLVIHHEQFEWLHRLSELIVQVDDLLHADKPITADAIALLMADVRTLLTPDPMGDRFSSKYSAALQTHPEVVMAHADVVSLLSAHAA